MANVKQAGFTLIEVTLVMAISSLLAASVIAGYAGIREAIQFSDAVDQSRAFVLKARTEANATVNLNSTNAANAGTNMGNIVIGRILTINGNNIQVKTLVTANNNNPSTNQAVTAITDNETSFTMKWGAKFAGNPYQVAFVRSPLDGSLRTTVSGQNGWSGMDSSYAIGDFFGTTVPAAKEFTIQSADNKKSAILKVDPATNGITRSFNQ